MVGQAKERQQCRLVIVIVACNVKVVSISSQLIKHKGFKRDAGEYARRAMNSVPSQERFVRCAIKDLRILR